ncbi:DgyrCDS8066 [Dimorphilus gyrociliatus]|uniref:DgyrCDS8066 n=1 Tax=Dimorphilus gyrociliatus TaxID=2664684 RepID=A0A7I8VUR7_9ANNE|nr:DgyrCDS8066 [Dimorphilus gyrociliatus]
MSLKQNDYVWAKMKGYREWPGKISIIVKPNLHSAWIAEDQLHPYEENKDKFLPTNAKKSLKDAVAELEKTRDSNAPLEPFKSPDEKAFFSLVEEKERDKKPRGRPPKRTSSPVTSTASSEVKKSKTAGAKSELAESSTEASMRRHSTKFTWGVEEDDTNSQTSRDGTPKRESGVLAATATPTSTIPTPQRIGFLGIGNMGHGMVANLLRSGHEVTIWNRSNSKVSENEMNICMSRSIFH